jgi:hypothetical protein
MDGWNVFSYFCSACRLTIALIQIGAKGEVQPFETGKSSVMVVILQGESRLGVRSLALLGGVLLVDTSLALRA